MIVAVSTGRCSVQWTRAVVSTVAPGLSFSRSASAASTGRAVTVSSALDDVLPDDRHALRSVLFKPVSVRAGGLQGRLGTGRSVRPCTGQWHARPDSRLDDEYGRGLAIVAALADKFDHDATPEGQTLWAEVMWP